MPKAKAAKGSGGVVSKKSGGSKGGQWRWLWLTFLVVFADLMSKSMASYYLSEFNAKPVIPGIDLVLAHNRGAAFSMFDSANGGQLWLLIAIAIVVSVGILSWLWRATSMHPLTAIALSLILAGAIGNLANRIVLGYVIDFIDVYYKSYHWPTFNVADSAICLGTGFLILSAFRKA